MADDFDPAALQALVDGIEGQGAPPEMVEQLRELVREKAELEARKAATRLVAGEPIRAGDLLEIGPDGRLRPVPSRRLTEAETLMVGMAMRDIRPDEVVSWGPESRTIG